ncbi:DUF4129 domain-containing protein [Halosolutus gelatinilyticus]|uniref:DUF4129 domain-containing protein n=1 Tax=Halosolutus gelatinilyticus TaxID=2931975 RepID=UPI001FF619A6|nr:DUF4129 domain-containing protein [Halosolutus gelatinilyticus]
MDQRTVLVAIVAVVGVLAVSLAAATLPSTVDVESGLGGGGGGGSGEGEGTGVQPPPASDRPVDAVEIPFVKEILLVVLGLILLALLVYFVRNWRQSVPWIVIVVVFVALLVLALFLFSGSIPTGDEPVPESAGDGGLGGEGDGGGLGSGDSTPVPTVVLLALTIALLGAIVVAARSSAARSTVVDRLRGADPNADEDEDDAAAIGRAAGRAADRIEDGDDIGNDVLRAWREMIDLLEVSRPETTTPREFATVAVDAGMDSDDVRELTRLFEDVRYGEYSPTTEREKRAVRVFRRIERTYGADDE